MTKRVRSTRRIKRRKKQQPNQRNLTYEIGGIVLFILGILSLLSVAGYNMGIVGEALKNFFDFLFGKGAYIPAAFIIWEGFRYISRGDKVTYSARGIFCGILFILILAAFEAWMVPSGEELSKNTAAAYGGLLGGIIVMALRSLFGEIGAIAILLGAILVNILLITRWSLSHGVQAVGKRTEKQVVHMETALRAKREEYRKRMAERDTHSHKQILHDFIFKKKDDTEDKSGHDIEDTPPVDENDEKPVTEPVYTEPQDIPLPEEEPEPVPDNVDPETGEVLTEAVDTAEEVNQAESEPAAVPAVNKSENGENISLDAAGQDKPSPVIDSGYKFPPLSLLKPGGKQTAGQVQEAQRKRHVLETTLKNFGVNAKVINTSIGPSVTRYELEPAPGVKVKKIENLADDLALSLAATHLRIEAPIPGKSAVGIEVPNGKTTMVALRDVLESKEFREKKGDVCVALGKDISGHTIVTDLAKMPHLLIAGSTGSGKSVCINTLIMSILYRYKPEDVKMILIDPKVVELSIYNCVPHLLSPVVTSPQKAAGALQWAVKQMEARYELFSGSQVRDIHGYNRLHPESKMPFLIVIIDELADLMMAAPDSVEESICRLAQKARAAGIHLVLATQRPSVDVITGLIKANIPSRISFAVSSQIDSRTILDQAGAENLLGRGDMLFAPIGAQNMIRVQGAFVSDEEVEHVTSYIQNEVAVKKMMELEKPVEFTEPVSDTGKEENEEKDELLDEAIDWLVDTKKASVSMLQRRFRIGYTRAGRLMDTIESMGIVGPQNGSKQREILMTKDEIREKYYTRDKDKEVNHG